MKDNELYGVKAKTHYKFECLGPKEVLRETYIILRNWTERLERWKKRIGFKFFFDFFLRHLHEITGSMLEVKWQAEFDNLVTTAGLNKLLDACFKTGLTTPAWYVGLKGTGTPVAGDTMGSHASWSTITAFSNSTLPAFTAGTIATGSLDNSNAKATFNINAGATIYGAFMTDNNSVSGTTGTLYGAGDFSGGSKAVTSGDTLNVTVTLTITAS